MLIRSVLCLSLVLVAACGKDEPQVKSPPKADAQVRSTVAALAPADSAVLVQCASASKFSNMIRSMGESVGAETPPDPLAMMFAGAGVDGSRVDQSKPMAFAAVFPKEARPTMTWILPFADAKAAAEAHEGAARFEGSYAALASELDLGEGGCALADGLLAGDLSMRVDVSALVEVFRKDIYSAMQMLGQGMQQTYGDAGAQMFGAAEMSKMMSDAIRTTLDSVETMDCVVNYGETGRLDLDFAMNVKAGSPLDDTGAERADLAALASRMQGDFPCVLLFRFDMQGYLKLVEGVMDGMVQGLPEERRAEFKAYLDRSIESMDHLTGDWAMGFEFSENGFSALMVAGAKDGETYLREYVELLKSSGLAEMGMTWSDAGERSVSGTTVHSSVFAIDFEKYLSLFAMELPPEFDSKEFESMMARIFGEEGLRFELAAKDDVVYMTMGADPGLMDQALAGGDTAAHLQSGLARVPGRTEFLLHLEMRGLVKGLAGLVNTIAADKVTMTVPDGPPLPITMAGATEGRVHRLGASVELKRVADFFRAIERRPKRR